MSRRCHHGSPRHAPLGRILRRPLPGEMPRRGTTMDLESPRAAFGEFEPSAAAADALIDDEPEATIAAAPTAESTAAIRMEPPPAVVRSDARDASVEHGPPVAPARAIAQAPAGRAAPRIAAPVSAPRAAPPMRAAQPPRGPQPAARPLGQAPEGEDGAVERTATAPQLRRFIKSRAYVPMHELRRRFGINGGDDEVTPVDLERTRVFVGLPEREGRLLSELLRAGDIGYELSLDPISPIVVGVYPMRPVTRG